MKKYWARIEIGWVWPVSVIQSITERLKRPRSGRIVQILEERAKREGETPGLYRLSRYFQFQGIFGALWRKEAEHSVHIGEAYGLRALADSGLTLTVREFSWFDTGNLDALEKARDEFGGPEQPNILEKRMKAIWFVSDQVIKFSHDPEFILNRVTRN